MAPVSDNNKRQRHGRISKVIAFALTFGVIGDLSAYPGSLGTALSLACQLRISAAGGAEAHAQNLYDAADAVVQSKCLGCHIEDGLAPKAGASLALRQT